MLLVVQCLSAVRVLTCCLSFFNARPMRNALFAGIDLLSAIGHQQRAPNKFDRKRVRGISKERDFEISALCFPGWRDHEQLCGCGSRWCRACSC
jgi:hypothetical protein